MNRDCLGCGLPIGNGSYHARCKPPSPSSLSWRGRERVRREVLARDGGCVVCGATEDLEVHHIVPAHLGGLTVPGNLEVRCRRHHAG